MLLPQAVLMGGPPPLEETSLGLDILLWGILSVFVLYKLVVFFRIPLLILFSPFLLKKVSNTPPLKGTGKKGHNYKKAVSSGNPKYNVNDNPFA